MATHAPDESSPVHIIGVSIPRSGHNYAVRLLQATLPTDLFYCEYYGVPGCCQAVPCARRGTQPISFQKSHDFDPNLPTDLPGVHYLAMYRSPAPAILSNRELYAEDYGDEIAANRDEYAVWLGRNAEYYVTFYERWIRSATPNKIIIDYDEIAAQPSDVIRRLLGRIGRPADEETIRQAIISTSPHGGLFGERPYVPRSIEKSRYLDRELIAQFESIVLYHLPRLEARRVLEPVEFHGTVTWLVFAALRALRTGDLAAAHRLFESARDVAPDNALLLFEHAGVYLRENRFLEAQQALQRAAELFPTHRPILDALATVSLAAGDARAALGPTMALVDASPTLLHRLQLVLVQTHTGELDAGEDVLEEVERERPDDAAVWRQVSEIWHARGDLPKALMALDTAVRLAPLQGDLYFDRGQILLEDGQAGAAALTLREALAIDPSHPDWWQALIEAYIASGNVAAARSAIDEARGRFPFDVPLQAYLDGVAEQLSAGRTVRRRRRRVVMGGRRAAPTGGADPAGAARPRPKARRVTGPGSDNDHGQAAQLEVQLSQLRSALGAAERRLYETEVTKQAQLEEAWDEANRLSVSLAELDAAFKQQTADLREAWREAHLGWDRAHEGWDQAQAVSDELERVGKSSEAAWAQAELLNGELQAANVRLQVLSIWAGLHEANRLRLTDALDSVPALVAGACDESASLDEFRDRFSQIFDVLMTDLDAQRAAAVHSALQTPGEEVQRLLRRFFGMDPAPV